MPASVHKKKVTSHLTWVEAVAEHENVTKVLDHEEGELVIEGRPGNDELMNSGYWGAGTFEIPKMYGTAIAVHYTCVVRAWVGGSWTRRKFDFGSNLNWE